MSWFWLYAAKMGGCSGSYQPQADRPVPARNWHDPCMSNRPSHAALQQGYAALHQFAGGYVALHKIRGDAAAQQLLCVAAIRTGCSYATRCIDATEGAALQHFDAILADTGGLGCAGARGEIAN